MYVDGYVLAVPTANKQKYLDLASIAAPVFRDHGALKVVECWGDDVPQGKLTSFPMAVKCAENETVVFSWMIWPSKEARDAGLKSAMADPRMEMDLSLMPFDSQRMIFGGFRILLEQ